jgi:hypothetical protein
MKSGSYSATITIESNAGNPISIDVGITATCVLARPNPASLSRLHADERPLLTFFGSGIVPGSTSIRIYTLSGELVKELAGGSLQPGGGNTDMEITWNGKSGSGTPVVPGIYLYVHESPREKGVGKFTIVR